MAERFADLGVKLVRGAGLLRRPRRAAAAPRPGPGRHGHRRRRVRLRPALFPPDARGRRRGRPPGRRHAVRRDHRVPPRRRRSARRGRCRSRPTARRRCTSTRRCALPGLRHLEYFHDHDRIEHMLFDGAPTPVGGSLRPDLSRPGPGARVQATGCRAVCRSEDRRIRIRTKGRSSMAIATGRRTATAHAEEVRAPVRRRHGPRGRAATARSAARSGSTPAAGRSTPPTGRTTARCRSAS